MGIRSNGKQQDSDRLYPSSLDPHREHVAAFHPLLITRVRQPRLSPSLVHRSRLLKLLNEGLDRKVTLVSAGAGYGKSTLLGQWAASTDQAVAWLSLDTEHIDPSALFMDLVAAIQQVNPEWMSRTAEVLDGPALPGLTLTRTLLNDLSEIGQPLLIILDDVHRAASPEILESITFLIANLPGQIHVVLSSRSELDLPIQRLRARHEVNEVDEETLRFDLDEMRALLRGLLDGELSDEALRALDAQAEGWAACLLLLAHSAKRQQRQFPELLRSLGGTHSDVTKYLWSEVISGQAPDVRMFLGHIAILDRFTSDLCNSVTGLTNGEEMIHYLDHANLFLVHLDDQEEWFRLHHLMSAALRARLAETLPRDEIRVMHRRAAEWFERADLIEEATRHATAGEDWERATRLLVEICRDLFLHDRLKTLQTWLEPLPSEILDRNPYLAYWYAWALARQGKFRLALQPLAAAERAWEAGNDRENLAAVKVLYGLRDVVTLVTDQAIRRISESLAVLPEERSTERVAGRVLLSLAHNFAGRPIEAEREMDALRATFQPATTLWLKLFEMNASGHACLGQGRLEDAAVLFAQSIEIGDHWNHQQVQFASWLLASIEIERNHLDEAEQMLIYGIELAERMDSILHLTMFHQYLAEIAWSRKQHARAFHEIDQGVAFAAKIDTKHYLMTANARRARFWLQSDRMVLARRWAMDAGIDLTSTPAYPRLFEYLTAIRLRIHENDIEPALTALAFVERDAIDAGRTGDLIEILVLTALAHQKLENRPAALETLSRALDLGLPLGYHRVFLNNGEPVRQLLDRLSHIARFRGTIDFLQPADGVPPPATRVESNVKGERLSAREVEILLLVAMGEPNAAIAGRLFISETTVKKHVSNILAKLGANNRTHAVELARAAGMI